MSPVPRTKRSAQNPEGQISLFRSKETPDAFRKAVQIVHSKPKQPLSLLQRKLGNAWAKHAFDHEPDENGWWVLRLQDLEESVGFDSNNRQYLKESAEALMRIIFEWDVMSNEAKKPWKASVMFPEVEIHTDYVRYQISSQLRDLIKKPEIYALIDMNIVRAFKRAPAMAIWEFCVRYERLGRTAEVAWETFRDMILGESAESKTYQEYKYFKAKVLKPSIAEVNACTGLTISLIEIRSGKWISSIRFDVKRNEVPQDDDMDAEALPLVGEMVRLGVLQSEAKKMVREHPLHEVRAALEYTRQRMQSKKGEKLENPAAYFRNALQHRYAASGASTEERASKPPKKLDIREAYLNERMAEAEKYFKELDLGDQTRLMERYNESAAPALRLTKKASKAAEVAFRRWIAHEVWGSPSDGELLEFAQTMLSKQS